MLAGRHLLQKPPLGTTFNLSSGLFGSAPVLFLPMLEGFGQYTNETMPYSRQYTLQSQVGWGPSQFGSALNFLGDSIQPYSWISLGVQNRLLFGTNPFSFAVAIAPGTFSVKNFIIWSGSGQPSLGEYWTLNINTDGSLTWDLAGVNLTNRVTITTAPGAVSLNKMAVISGSRDASGNVFLYVNGLLAASGTGAIGVIDTPAGAMYLGRDDQIQGRGFQGKMLWYLVFSQSLPATMHALIGSSPNSAWSLFTPNRVALEQIVYYGSGFTLVASPATIPSNHVGNLTVTVSSNVTHWTGGTVFSVSGVSGISLVSYNIISPGKATVVLSLPGSLTSNPPGNTGTLLISDGANTALVNVGLPTISVTPSTLAAASVPVSVNGANTSWLQETPGTLFSVSGGVGDSVSGTPAISYNNAANLTIWTGSQLGTLTLTDNSTGAATTLSYVSYPAPVVATTYYIDYSGSNLYVFTGDRSSPSKPLPVQNLIAMPGVKVNGSPVTVVPFWDNYPYSYDPLGTPFIVFQLPHLLSSSDVVTFTAPANWIKTTIGSADGSPTLWTPGNVPNHVGQFEPPQFGYLPFDHLPLDSSGLLVGFNPGSGYNAYNALAGSIVQNWMKRGAQDNSGNPGHWTGVAYDPVTGRPSQITASNGVASAWIASCQDANHVDNTYFPGTTGVYRLTIDDSTGSMASALQWSMGQIGSIATITGPVVTPGTVQGGVLVGTTYDWTVTYAPGAATYSFTLVLFAKTPTGSPGAWTAQNEWFSPPNGMGGPVQTVDRTNPSNADQNLLRSLSSKTKGAAILRFMENLLNGTSNANALEVSDMRNPNDFLWTTAPTDIKFTVAQVRPYNLSTSPHVYVNNNSPNSTPNPGVTPPSNLAYYFTPPTTGFASIGSHSTYTLEFVFTSNHNFSTGHHLIIYGPSFNIQITNGSSATVNDVFPVINGDYSGSFVVTGPNSIVMIAESNYLTTSAGLPVNNLVGTYTPTGMTFEITPDVAITSYDSAGRTSAQVPGGNCIPWINIPVHATDAFVTSAAQRLFSETTPGQQVLVELSNEAWNFAQAGTYDYMMGTLTGISPGLAVGWYTFRAGQIHAIFRNYWAANGRDPDQIICAFGSQMVVPGLSQQIVNFLNTYNGNNPSAPFPMNALLVANYTDVIQSGGQWPQGPIAVNPTGGGSTGGVLAAGNYYVYNTWTDAFTGLETNVGLSESDASGSAGLHTPFAVASGNIPSITVHPPVAPMTASQYNIYLTPANGARGSGVLYMTVAATGATNQTINLATANTGTVPPPANDRTPSFLWAAASVMASDVRSIANPAINPGNIYHSNPWTVEAYLHYARHSVKYNQTWYGFSAQHRAAMASYNLLSGQSPPMLIAYEGIVQSICSTRVETAVPPIDGGFAYQLSHDLYYHPLQRFVELSWLQATQDMGFKYQAAFQLEGPRGNEGGGLADWGYIKHPAQLAGYGDGSDGLAVNKFCIIGPSPDNKCHDVDNVCVKLQAVHDWIEASGGSPPMPGDEKITQLAQFTTFTLNAQLVAVDPSDISMAPTGTDKWFSGTQLFAATPVSSVLDLLGGTAQGTTLHRGATGWAALPPGLVGQVYTSGGTGANPSWTTPATGGTVTSVGLTVPSWLAVGGSPITTSGVLAITANTQAPNIFLAGPVSGSPAVPGFRAMVGADLPVPSLTTLGGVFSAMGAVHHFMIGVDTGGNPTFSQISFTDVQGFLALSQIIQSGSAGMPLVGQGSGNNTIYSTTGLVITQRSKVIGTGTISGGACAFNLATNDSWALTRATSGTTTLSLTGGSIGQSGTIALTVAATADTIAWSGVDWGAAGPPTLSTTSGKVDIITYFTPDGTHFYMGLYGTGF
jgi:hypothetical protein